MSIVTAQTLEESLELGLMPQRVVAAVAGGLGLVGLLLAALGIYGVTAFVVARRTREIGIRIALGAQRADVIRLILRQGLSLIAGGAAVGLVLAAAAGRVLTAYLFGIPAVDPVTFLGVAVLFASVGLAACYAPVRRATRIHAMEALRPSRTVALSWHKRVLVEAPFHQLLPVACRHGWWNPRFIDLLEFEFDLAAGTHRGEQ